MTFDSAISSLKRGEFVMIHDSDGRENEIDMVVAAELITPEHIVRMRKHAGGLICLAIDNMLAEKLQLNTCITCYLYQANLMKNQKK